ncbi:MAG TPA: hypothetical protein VJU86_03215 [Pyrinomonadaceae bacterium]|nr:hypothetical protein [Pyrinomonadaceae bacterium]
MNCSEGKSGDEALEPVDTDAVWIRYLATLKALFESCKQSLPRCATDVTLFKVLSATSDSTDIFRHIVNEQKDPTH